MVAAIACTPAAPVHGSSACRIDITGADLNDTASFNRANYPSEPEISYYLAFLLGGEEKMRSYVFAPGPDGKHTFNNFMFDEAGSWTVRLNKVSDDSQAATLSVTVS